MKKFPFQKILDWHKENARNNLPWRKYGITNQQGAFSPFSKKDLGYRVWLSEIILQQTQVSRGIEYFNNILQAFPTVEDLARTDYDIFFEYYKGLGYYSRARNMLKTAIIISDKYNGIFPDTTRELLTLPGVGPYTAEAIRAFAYEKNTLSFDTNLHKVFSRYYYGNKFHTLTKDEILEIQEQFESFIKSPYPPSGTFPQEEKEIKLSGREMNNALMDFATEFNTLSKAHYSPSGKFAEEEKETVMLSKYPLPDCTYFTTQGKLEPLKKKKKTTFPTKQAQIVIILHKDHTVYFSDDLDNYKPFVLSPFSPGGKGLRIGGSREIAKAHFLETYNLNISVRPPHTKDFQNGKPYLVCYAQIQKGEHDFGEYTDINKSDIEVVL